MGTTIYFRLASPLFTNVNKSNESKNNEKAILQSKYATKDECWINYLHI